MIVKKLLEAKEKTIPNLRERHKRKGFGKFLKEILQGLFSSGDKEKHPEGVEKERIINRGEPDKDDSYQEKVKDVNTGDTTRDIKEPLSQHKNK